MIPRDDNEALLASDHDSEETRELNYLPINVEPPQDKSVFVPFNRPLSHFQYFLPVM